jgi:photosystem II stability/assembly factor-like uncharacterized protein
MRRTLGTRLLLLVLGVSFASPTCADDEKIKYSEWSAAKKIVWTNETYFNFVNDLALGQDGYAYAACDNGILRVSEDEGETWRITRTPLNEILRTVMANDAGLVIVTSSRHYAISLDHGKSWKVFQLGSSEKIFAEGVLPDTRDIIWLLLEKEPGSRKDEKGSVTLRTTSDGGAHWESPIPLTVKFDRIQPIDKVNAWARRGLEFFHTANGGRDWEKYPDIKLDKDDYIFYSFSFSTLNSIMAMTYKGHVFGLSEEGWQEKSVIALGAAEGVHAARFTSPTEAVAVSMSNEIFVLDKSAQSWQKKGLLSGREKNTYFWNGPRLLIRSSEGPIKVFELGWGDPKTTLDLPVGEPRKVAMSGDGKHLTIITSEKEVLASEDAGQSWRVQTRTGGAPAGPVAVAEDGWGLLIRDNYKPSSTNDGGANWAEDLPPFSPDGTVTQLAVATGEHAFVEVRHGEAWQGDFRNYRLVDHAWEQVPSQPTLRLFRYVPNLGLVGVNTDGVVQLSIDDGRQWRDISTDIRDWLKTARKGGESSPTIHDMFWTDAMHGWIAGDRHLIFKTVDGGVTWRQITHPSLTQADIASVYFLDSKNGELYDETGEESIFETSDGGDTWSKSNSPLSGYLQDFAFSQGGHGILLGAGKVYAASQNSFVVIDRVRTGLRLRASVTTAGLRSLRIRVETEEQALRRTDFPETSLLAKTRGSTEWSQISLGDKAISEDGTGIVIEWDPSDQRERFDPDQWIQQKLQLTDKAGILAVVTMPEVRYRPWTVRYQETIRSVVIIVAIAVGIFVVSVILYVARPYSLLLIMGLTESATEALKEIKLGFAAPLLKIFAFDYWLMFLVSRDRTITTWIRRWHSGIVELSDMPSAVFDRYIEREILLDAWVARLLPDSRVLLDDQLASLDIGQYVPVPVSVRRGAEADEDDLRETGTRAFRDLIGTRPMTLGVVGDGGTGKTTLAGELGRRVMSDDPEQRLIPSNTAIALFLHGNSNDFFKKILSELQKASHSDDVQIVADALVKNALRRRRLVPIIDGLSEMSDDGAESVQDLLASLHTSLVIFTARRRFVKFSTTRIEIRPHDLTADDINRFVARYIYLHSELRQRISPHDELALSKKLIEMLEQRSLRASLPAIFVKLLLESYDAHGDGAKLSLAEAMQRFVRHLGRSASDDPSGDLLVEAASVVARLSLQPNLLPHAVDGELARRALGVVFPVQATALLRKLIETTVLVEEVSATGPTVRFRLDPVAEYIAAASWIREYRDDLGKWNDHLGPAETATDRGMRPTGYLEALLECLEALEPSSVPPDLATTLRRLLDIRAALLKEGTEIA